MLGDKEEDGSLCEEVTISTGGDAAAGRVRGDSPPAAGGLALQSGQMVGERYRIVGHLGSGGMGEVYRADDLTLGTSVALKFLPPDCVADPVRVERLKNEVRLARQVSHPNVCRVYDLAEAEGRSFLVMEFIDGEDLASLLRRIGRLPGDKAVELARQICAGVAAAHQHDIIHRDLKPANVMIDGRGKARVTDFGLAGVIHELAGDQDRLAGTPAYMAPEQIEGGEVTRGTDIYALGLVLYELFTGMPAHSASTVAELRRLHASSATPTNPSELIDGMDPVAERVIMRCLEPDPRARPASAFAVAVGLPGGDPLVAVLEAGETPSPELVAASGRSGILSPAKALRLAALALTGMALSTWFFGTSSLDHLVGEVQPRQVLEHRAREVLAAVGQSEPPVDTAWGFDLDPHVVTTLAPLSPAQARAVLRSDDPPLLRFWYRQSPAPMSPWRASLPGATVGNVVTPDDPPFTEPGMALVRLDPRGRLLELRLEPGPTERPVREAETPPPAVAALFAAARLDQAAAEPLGWRGLSPMPGSTTLAWRAPAISDPTRQGHVVVTLAGDLPTYFATVPENKQSIEVQAVDPRGARFEQITSLVFLGFFVSGALLAFINVRARRWDRRGAGRLAAASFVLCFSSSLLGDHHTWTAAGEARWVFSAVAYAGTRALMTWLLYVAIEPLIRRLHPSSLVSWSRLLAGRLRDPAIGRDVLLGLAVSGLQGASIAVWYWARGWSGAVLPVFALGGNESPLTLASILAVDLRLPVVGLGYGLGALLVYAGLRALLGRNRWAAVALLWLVILLFFNGPMLAGSRSVDAFALAIITTTTFTYLAVRGSLLGLAVGVSVFFLSVYSVITLDPSSWYVAPTATLVVLLLALTAFGVRTATAGARLRPRTQLSNS